MFNFITEEHRIISESVRKLFEDLVAADAQERQRGARRIDSVTVGCALTELGLFPTAAADASMSSAQVQALVALEAGAACLPFPVLEGLAASALAVLRGASGSADAGALATLSSADCNRTELPVLENGRLYGSARLVPFAGLAARVVVTARHGSDVVLVEVALANAGIERRARATVEADYPLHDLRFDGAAASLLIECLDNGGNVAAFLQQRSSLLAAAEIAGACRRMIGMTRDYLLTRSQFGQVLGANQALKHALADGHVRVEALAAAIDYAAVAVDAGAADAEAAVCAAKHFAGRAGKSVADGMLQLHGAIGYTMEFPLHLLMRRVYRLTASYGAGQIQGERLFQIFRECA
jgi:alkylation response protein AidB-like acyl-CoA dehydrogenase